MPRRVILDTDPGIDDSLAILLALISPEVELAAVSVTSGNCELASGVRNALGVAEVAGHPELPICAGVAVPLLRPLFTAPETHGDAGLGYARLPEPTATASPEHAVDMIIREIMEHPGETTLVAVAPLTNVAMAIRKEPRIVEAVHEVIIMGGALRADGNTTSLAEFNFFVDPHAAHIVLQSGMPITLLPWDITKDVLLTQADVDRLLAIDSPVSRLVADTTRFYIEFHEQCFGFSGCSINDPIALGMAYDKSFAKTVPMRVDIEYTSELTMGKTVIGFVGDATTSPDDHDQLGFNSEQWPMAWGRLHRPKPNVQAVVEFDGPGFVAHFVERIEQLAREQQTKPAAQPAR